MNQLGQEAITLSDLGESVSKAYQERFFTIILYLIVNK